MDMDTSKLAGGTQDGARPRAPWDDPDACVSPALAAYARRWNDALAQHCPDLLPDLLTYAPRLVGTAGDPEAERRRAWLAADWAVRVAAPAYLRHAGLPEQAERLAALPPVTDATWREARGACWREALDTCRAAAWDAVADAAYAAWAAGGDDTAAAAAWAADAAWAGGADDATSAAVLRELHPTMCALFEAMLAPGVRAPDGRPA